MIRAFFPSRSTTAELRSTASPSPTTSSSSSPASPTRSSSTIHLRPRRAASRSPDGSSRSADQPLVLKGLTEDGREELVDGRVVVREKDASTALHELVEIRGRDGRQRDFRSRLGGDD